MKNRVVTGSVYPEPALKTAGSEKEEANCSTAYQPTELAAFASNHSNLMGIIHDIKTPLSNINLSASFILAEVGKPDLITYFNIIERSTERIAHLVSALLKDPAVSASCRASLEDRLDLNDLLSETILLAHDKCELKKIQVTSEFDSGKPMISGKANRIVMALSNIMTNAIEAVNANTGVISVSSKIMRDSCEIIIADNGIGIAESDVGKIFHSGFTTKIYGDGVGLMLTKRILIESNASIAFKSNKGVGTRFIITFPLAR